MSELQRLRADHAEAVLAFELANREFFAATVPDRGDAYFAEFAARHAALLAEQDTGTIHMHVLVEDRAVVGRVNLIDVDDGHADLGYRLARSATGRGLATDAVRRVCELAVRDYGLRELRAKTTLDNTSSLAVLRRCGFTPAGDLTLDGRPARHFTRDLTTTYSAVNT